MILSPNKETITYLEISLVYTRQYEVSQLYSSFSNFVVGIAGLAFTYAIG